MKHILKLRNVFLLCLVTTLIACSNDSNDEMELTQEKVLSLVSPNGKKLADSQDELLELFTANSNLKKSTTDIEIIDIRYSEMERYSFGVVDLQVDESLNSMLILLEVSDNTKILSDSDGIRFVEFDKSELAGIDEDDILLGFNAKSSPSLQSETVFVCNGGCCGWSQTGEDAYNCGCPQLTVSTSLTLTTSDGYSIQVIEK